MRDKISVFHRVMLWLCLIFSFFFGFTAYLYPSQITCLLRMPCHDYTAVATIGGFLIAAFVGAAYSLKSCSWYEVKITTYCLMTCSLLIGVRMIWFAFAHCQKCLLPYAILCLVIGIGLAVVVIQRKYCYKCWHKNKDA